MNQPVSPQNNPHRVLLVTGLSGAGRSSALKALEDMGYEAVDNLPLSLLSSLVQPDRMTDRPLAIGVDIRTRDFGAEPFLHEVDALIKRPDLDARVVFLDCEDEVLRRRYTETRRRHPLAQDRPVMDGIRHERRLLEPLRERADTIVHTTDLILGDLQRILHGHFGLEENRQLAIFVTSFSYRLGLPPEADLVFDVRFLTNPHYEPNLRPLTGLDESVGNFILQDADYNDFFSALTSLLKPLLPRFNQEGKSYLTIAVGCTGGRHRSVFLAERIAEWLQNQGERVSVAHRDIPKDRA